MSGLFLFTLLWVLIALAPVPNPQVRRTLLLLVVGVSVTAIAYTFFEFTEAGVRQRDDDTDRGLLTTALLVAGPGALVALLRLATANHDRS
ncbi:hypothetical protein GCM10022247_00490 [Allokutzneria multivorans]|uniref:Uncharacterized protein n=1 Tax=Allokutzneria multivorans TaxID=1142134 RepID=A0ABP7QPE1_9PSEU